MASRSVLGRVCLAATIAALFLCPTASAQFPSNFCEDFDSFVAGSGIKGQNGWDAWDGDIAWDSNVSNAQSFSAPNSLDVLGASDTIHQFDGATSGMWEVRVMQYVPSGCCPSGTESFFILLNEYEHLLGQANNWSVQVKADTDLMWVEADFLGETLPLFVDQWVEIRVEIDLDNDVQRYFYGGQLLYEDTWTERLSGPGTLEIDAVDLWANFAGTVYYDDFSLLAAGASCPGGCVGDLDGDGDTDLADLGILLADFGCAAPGPCPGDLDGDGDTDLADLGILLADFGCTP